jgi:hypothetical protein
MPSYLQRRERPGRASRQAQGDGAKKDGMPGRRALRAERGAIPLCRKGGPFDTDRALKALRSHRYAGPGITVLM